MNGIQFEEEITTKITNILLEQGFSNDCIVSQFRLGSNHYDLVVLNSKTSCL